MSKKTFRDKAIEYLTSNGMFESQAKATMELVEQDDDLLFNKWGDKISDYPDVMINLVLMPVRSKALEWIDANAPEAWYRGMFEDSK